VHQRDISRLRGGSASPEEGVTPFLRSRYAIFWMRVSTSREVPIGSSREGFRSAFARVHTGAQRRNLEGIVSFCLRAGRFQVAAVTAVLVTVVAFADRAAGNAVSLSVFYILPMMVGATILEPVQIAGLALLCAAFRARFDVPSSQAEAVLRFIFASLAYFTTGLFVMALVRNREQTVEHLGEIQREHELRQEAEAQLSGVMESSPAAILTVDRLGRVLAANQAANRLFSIPSGQSLQGRTIEHYLPVLGDALSLEAGPEAFRTAAQCQGRRENGDVFLAHTWFSSYGTATGTRLAAIVVDASEEIREREEQNLRQLMEYNRIAASGVSHEVRNLCGALSLLSSNLREKHNLGGDADYKGLVTLVKGLERIATFDLQARGRDTVEAVPLQEVLGHLRIMIEPAWQEADGRVDWSVPLFLPAVVADPQGLLQVFLNLAHNSLRAVGESPSRRLDVQVLVQERMALISFQDSGPGVEAPERLFQPFQPGADGTGLGLYISRAMVRSYGGDLRFDPGAGGCCFVVELPVA
jgi:two-component system, LuxR family, sensor kinase FixL